MEVEIRSFLIRALLLLGVFPYLSPVRLDFDTSPFYLIVSVMLIAWAIMRDELVLPRTFWLLAVCWLLLASATVARMLFIGDAGSLRIAIAFLAQVILILAFGAAFSGPGAAQRVAVATRFFAAALYWGGWCWLAAALLQLYSFATGSTLGSEITVMFVTASRTTEGRGITALAAEPSFAGMTCSILIAACWLLKLNGLMPRGRANIASVCYLLVILSSLSFVSYLALAIAGFFVARRLTTWITISIVAVAAIALVPWDTLQQLRIVQLINTITSTPELILADVSAASRAADILSQFRAMTMDGGLFGHLAEPEPYGLQQAALQSVGGTVTPHLLRGLEEAGPGARAMSSLGLLAMYFGVIGLAVYAFQLVTFYRTTAGKGLLGMPALLAVGTFGYLVQLPFSYPTISIVMLLLCSLALHGVRVTRVSARTAARNDGHFPTPGTHAAPPRGLIP